MEELLGVIQNTTGRYRAATKLYKKDEPREEDSTEDRAESLLINGEPLQRQDSNHLAKI